MERRQAARIPTNFTVRLQTQHGPLTATLVDMSRSGIRLSVSIHLLGAGDVVGAGEVEAKAAAFFGQPFDIVFNPHTRDELVIKRVGAVHLIRAAVSMGQVELGAEFTDWINDAEARALGLVLPARTVKVLLARDR